MKQGELADAVGKTDRTISQIENGAVATSLDTLIRIAEALDIEVWRLFKFGDDIDARDAARFKAIAEMVAKLSTVSDKSVDLVVKLADVVAEHDETPPAKASAKRRALPVRKRRA